VVAVEALAPDLVQGTHLPQGVHRGDPGEQLQEDARAPREVHHGVGQPQHSRTNLCFLKSLSATYLGFERRRTERKEGGGEGGVIGSPAQVKYTMMLGSPCTPAPTCVFLWSFSDLYPDEFKEVVDRKRGEGDRRFPEVRYTMVLGSPNTLVLTCMELCTWGGRDATESEWLSLPFNSSKLES